MKDEKKLFAKSLETSLFRIIRLDRLKIKYRQHGGLK